MKIGLLNVSEMNKVIEIQKIGDFDNKLLLNLQKCLNWQFRPYSIDFIVNHNSLPLTEAEYNHQKEKYDASLILRILFNIKLNSNKFCCLGIMDNDLFKDYQNFVFGVGVNFKNKNFKSPNLALVSVTRLKESYYRKPENEILTLKRTLKEVVHELGHTLGLGHCNNFCIMKFSETIYDTDKKPSFFCKKCIKMLNKFKI